MACAIGKWKRGRKPADPCWFNFDPYPYDGFPFSSFLTKKGVASTKAQTLVCLFRCSFLSARFPFALDDFPALSAR